MENYTYELARQGKIFDLEKAYEKEYPQIKVSAYLHFNEKDIIMIVCDKYMHFIKAFIAKDFDCKEFEVKYLPQKLKELPKSDKYCDDNEIRKFYLRFMKSQFETYYSDYKKHQLQQIDQDFNISKN